MQPSPRPSLAAALRSAFGCWPRLARRLGAGPIADPADMGTCFGLEAALQDSEQSWQETAPQAATPVAVHDLNHWVLR